MYAIIPARGGSKGLPGKNIKDLKGKPLIAYTVEAALRSQAISRVIVSTDCSEIAEVAKRSGAEVPFLRPGHLASDEARAIDNYVYTIDRLSKDSGQNISEFCVLQPTSPLRQASDIDQAVDLFTRQGADSVISYCEELHPISWHKYLSDEGKLIDTPIVTSLDNRQALRPSYYPNGAIYVFKYSLIKSGLYSSDNTFAYIMPRNRSVDIDTIDDFNYAEFLMDKV